MPLVVPITAWIGYTYACLLFKQLNITRRANPRRFIATQASFCTCPQGMRDECTLYCRLSSAGYMYKIINAIRCSASTFMYVEETGGSTQQPNINSFPLDKMATFSQTVFSDAFSLIKSFLFGLTFPWSLFLRVQLTIAQHWFGSDNGLAPNRRQAIIWTNADSIHWRIYAALGVRWVITH